MKTLTAISSMGVLFLTCNLSAAQDFDCASELTRIENSANELEQEMIKKDSDHPLVVVMADGSFSDLRGEEPRSQPLESWMTGEGSGRNKYQTGFTAAKEFQAKGAPEDCRINCRTSVHSRRL